MILDDVGTYVKKLRKKNIQNKYFIGYTYKYQFLKKIFIIKNLNV